MDVGMRDERVKAQLFRFIDVLPVLGTPGQINAHLREYLMPVRDRLPLGAGRGATLDSTDGWGEQLDRRLHALQHPTNGPPVYRGDGSPGGDRDDSRAAEAEAGVHH